MTETDRKSETQNSAFKDSGYVVTGQALMGYGVVHVQYCPDIFARPMKFYTQVIKPPFDYRG